MSMQRAKVLLAVFIAAAAPAALAHGEPAHGKKSGHRAAQADEEKPFGRPGDPKKPARSVKIEMLDTMRFVPATLEFRRGENVKFVVRNSGRQMHEMVLGTLEELKAHAELMRKHPAMEHDEPWMAHVAPGKSATLHWQFTRAGEFHYGCLIPGHFEAGMVGRITVK
ncbi:MAG: cupredoxin family protein [Burkholderiales bacterium]|nr:cupredoxin family protein [Burkholderiales bacterium]